jgi:probable LLM family oxidoreductase
MCRGYILREHLKEVFRLANQSDSFYTDTVEMSVKIERWIGMFGDVTFDSTNGEVQSMQDRLIQIVEQVQLADQLGVDLFTAGEHHRLDYAISSPEILLAALSSVTKNITLASGVSVISSADPVKLYQDFATIDLLSDGRAEIIAGRGSFTESFPLFGYDLEDYGNLFTEKLDLLLQIIKSQEVTRSWKHRASMVKQNVLPRAKNNGKIPVWIAVGGTPESVIRAATLGLPVIFAIIGGRREQFLGLIELYKTQYEQHGHEVSDMQIGVHMHTFVMDEERQLVEQYFPLYKAQMDRIGKSRGRTPYTEEQFVAGMSPYGALCMGTPKQVAHKIALIIKTLGVTRFVGHMDVWGPPHATMMHTIDLYAQHTIPQANIIFAAS